MRAALANLDEGEFTEGHELPSNRSRSSTSPQASPRRKMFTTVDISVVRGTLAVAEGYLLLWFVTERLETFVLSYPRKLVTA